MKTDVRSLRQGAFLAPITFAVACVITCAPAQQVNDKTDVNAAGLTEINKAHFQYLLDKWHWGQTQDAFNKSKQNPMGVDTSQLPGYDFMVTVSGVELEFSLSEKAPAPWVFVGATIPTEKDVISADIVNRLEADRIQATWDVTKDESAGDEYRKRPNGYFVYRTIELGTTSTEGTFKSDIEAFAERVKKLPRK